MSKAIASMVLAAMVVLSSGTAHAKGRKPVKTLTCQVITKTLTVCTKN